MMPLLFLSMVLKMFSTISPRALLAAAETATDGDAICEATAKADADSRPSTEFLLD